MNFDIFKSFRQIVIWGFPLHTHTHSYIHGAWFKAFKHLGFNVYWFHDKDYPINFDYTNTLFITEGWADDKIPVESSSTYFVHIAKNPSKYLDKGARLIEIRYNVKEIQDFNYSYKLPENPIYLSKDTFYEIVSDDSAVAYRRNREINKRPYEVIYMYWATDLLPGEFKYEDIFTEHEETIYYVGSPNDQINNFSNYCKNKKINFVNINPWNKPISYEENISLMKKSLCAPDFRTNGDYDKFKQYGKMNGTNHLDIGYIPCRVFKAISYGQIGLTNSPRVKEIMGDNVEYFSNFDQIFEIIKKRQNDFEWKLGAMKYVEQNHTYLNRINDLGRALIMKNNQATVISALYNINRHNIDGRTIENYLEWFKKTCSSISLPMIIYLDKKINAKNILLENRNGVTYFIETELSEVPMYKYYNEIKDVLCGEFKNKMKHPKDITNLIPEYCIIQYSKFGWLENAIQKNIFNSEIYLWMDAGLSRFYNHNIKVNLKIPNNFNHFAIQSDVPSTFLKTLNENEYIGTNQCYLHGWMWVIHKNVFNEIKNEIMNIFENEMLKKNKIDNEQIALGLCYKKCGDKFLLIQSEKANYADIYSKFFI